MRSFSRIVVLALSLLLVSGPLRAQNPWNRVPRLPTGCYHGQDNFLADVEAALAANRAAGAQPNMTPSFSPAALAFMESAGPRLSEFEARLDKLVADVDADRTKRLPIQTEERSWATRYNRAYEAFCGDWFRAQDGGRGSMEIFGFLKEYRDYLTEYGSALGVAQEAVDHYLSAANVIFGLRDEKPKTFP